MLNQGQVESPNVFLFEIVFITPKLFSKFCFYAYHNQNVHFVLKSVFSFGPSDTSISPTGNIN